VVNCSVDPSNAVKTLKLLRRRPYGWCRSLVNRSFAACRTIASKRPLSCARNPSDRNRMLNRPAAFGTSREGWSIALRVARVVA
jgi:hypothetical protein